MHIHSSGMRRTLLAALSFSLLTALSCAHAAEVTASDTQEIRDLFLRQAAAETAHDINALDAVMAPARIVRSARLSVLGQRCSHGALPQDLRGYLEH
jgi:hypothetical protein